MTQCFGANAWTVILTTSAPLTEGPIYTLGVQNVLDLGVPPNAVAPGTQATFQYNSLIGYWRFEEGSGTTTADSSGNNLTGTLLNGPPWVTPGQVGSGALNFDGANDRVSIGNPALLQITGPMTLSAWAFPDTISQGGRIVTKCDVVPHRGWGLGVNNNNTWAFEVASDPSTLVALTVPGVLIGDWTHVAGVYDPNDMINGPIMKLYINGVLAGTLTGFVPSAQTDTGVDVGIGARFDGTVRWDGNIDEVRVYARALSDAEVAALPMIPRFLPPIFDAVNNELILTWTGQGQLQAAPTVTGIYTNITPAPKPPYTNTVVLGENRFFRLLPTP